MKKHAAQIFAAILLLLPVQYVGSYLALVKPHAHVWNNGEHPELVFNNYRLASGICGRIYWPLEQIDRKVRPDTWWR